MTLEGVGVGKISKTYAGFIKEAISTADNFSISCNLKYTTYIDKIYNIIMNYLMLLVPQDLSVKMKSTLLGALFLIVSFRSYFCVKFLPR